MDIEEFMQKREYLYHLTSRENATLILKSREILSTVSLAEIYLDKEKSVNLIRNRRPEHVFVDVDGTSLMIRDQNPISIKSLNKCLLDGWTAEDFIEHLNKRVFFWPTLKRLNIHFEKYKEENPVIFRVKSSDLFSLPENSPLFCRLNSGATRCHHTYGGAPPPRGKNTFLPAEDYERIPSTVAEVTFEDACQLPAIIWTALKPSGPWTRA